jgi:hypothetical protein
MALKTYISHAAWDGLRLDYFAGNGRVRELATKHGINPGTAETRAKRERWTAQRNEFLAKKRELLTSPSPAVLPGLNPPNGCLPRAVAPPNGQNFEALNERFHKLAVPILNRVEEGLAEMADPCTPAERLALANSVRALTQTAREILGIPLVAPIKRKEKFMRRPIMPMPIEIEDPPCSPCLTPIPERSG